MFRHSKEKVYNENNQHFLPPERSGYPRPPLCHPRENGDPEKIDSMSSTE